MYKLDVLGNEVLVIEIALALDRAKLINILSNIIYGAKIINIQAKDPCINRLLFILQTQDHSFVFEPHKKRLVKKVINILKFFNWGK